MNLGNILKVIHQSPLFAVLLVWLLREFVRFIRSKQQLRLSKGLLLSGQTEVSIIQTCLLSTESLLDLGRIEKRTLFVRYIKNVIYNPYLRQVVIEAAHKVEDEHILRELDEREKYHVLQNCVNHVSTLFARNYVEQNALGGTHGGQDAFHSTWYCLTLLLENPETEQEIDSYQQHAATMCNMRFRPQPSLKIILVNETELRKIHDGKMTPPAWGLFNARHDRRWNRLKEIAKHFHDQLLQTDTMNEQEGARGHSMWTPFPKSFGSPDTQVETSQHDSVQDLKSVHIATNRTSEDGGNLRRIRSEGCCADLTSYPVMSRTGGNAVKESSAGGVAGGNTAAASAGARRLENSFLRIHIPHTALTRRRVY
eukprot:GEMP01026353.1.p1 GENE.GEMP01026353.1~~GEMP01026353.1.p1  ORF type:complete len:368 (+),score=40.21 GEMP01026353.1:188-1291(+)